MIEESIKAVREAEAKAESLILDAQKNAAEIVKAAEAKAETDKSFWRRKPRRPGRRHLSRRLLRRRQRLL